MQPLRNMPCIKTKQRVPAGALELSALLMHQISGRGGFVERRTPVSTILLASPSAIWAVDPKIGSMSPALEWCEDCYLTPFGDDGLALSHVRASNWVSFCAACWAFGFVFWASGRSRIQVYSGCMELIWCLLGWFCEC